MKKNRKNTKNSDVAFVVMIIVAIFANLRGIDGFHFAITAAKWSAFAASNWGKFAILAAAELAVPYFAAYAIVAVCKTTAFKKAVLAILYIAHKAMQSVFSFMEKMDKAINA